MKKAKKVIVSMVLTLLALILINGCQMATGNGAANTFDDSSWNMTVKSYPDGIVSEAESAQYRVVASVGEDTLHMHADEQEKDIVLAGKQDTVIVALVTCKTCNQSRTYNIAATECEQTVHFKCDCGDQKLVLRFYGVGYSD